MATLYTHKSKNIRLSLIYLLGFLIFVIFLGWIFSYLFNNPIILYGAVIFAVFMNFVSFWWSDKIILAASGAKEVTPENAKEIYRLVENLCITAGLPVPKIYIIPEMAPNAFATGRDPQHAVIAITTGLIERLERSELEGVIAHELSHIGNRDILLSMVVTTLVGFVVLLSDWALRWSLFGFGGRNEGNNEGNQGGQLKAMMTIVALILAILAPIFATLLQLAISRKREFLADADGALLTRYPEGLARALEKISSSSEELSTANRATAHMFIVNPLKGKNETGFLAKFFMTHPPVEERIKRLRQMA